MCLKPELNFRWFREQGKSSCLPWKWLLSSRSIEGQKNPLYLPQANMYMKVVRQLYPAHSDPKDEISEKSTKINPEFQIVEAKSSRTSGEDRSDSNSSQPTGIARMAIRANTIPIVCTDWHTRRTSESDRMEFTLAGSHQVKISIKDRVLENGVGEFNSKIKCPQLLRYVLHMAYIQPQIVAWTKCCSNFRRNFIHRTDFKNIKYEKLNKKGYSKRTNYFLLLHNCLQTN